MYCVSIMDIATGTDEHEAISYEVFEDAYEAAQKVANTTVDKLNSLVESPGPFSTKYSVEKRHPSVPKDYVDKLGLVELFLISDGASNVKVVSVAYAPRSL